MEVYAVDSKAIIVVIVVSNFGEMKACIWNLILTKSYSRRIRSAFGSREGLEIGVLDQSF